MIPRFPAFTNLQLEHKEEVQRITNNYLPYSDYNFVSLWGYNTKNDIEISVINENLVVLFRDYLTGDSFYSFIGETRVSSTVRELMAHSVRMGLRPELKLIPGIVIDSIDDKSIDHEFDINRDRDNFDYILSTESVAAMSSSDYRRHRKKTSRFYKSFPDARMKILDLDDDGDLNEIYKTFDNWKSKRDISDNTCRHEFAAIQRTLNSRRHYTLVAFGAFVKTRLVGFLIFDRERSDAAEPHFLKYDPEFDGAISSLRKFACEYLMSQGCLYANIEQDMGIRGLRAYKEGWKPCDYLEKYVVRMR